MTTLKAVRGTRDLLPTETTLWNRIEATARQVFARYNFGEIRTPIFEDTGLFARGVGEETDIVSKEMFTWADRERFDKVALSRAWRRDVISKSAAWTRNTHLPHEVSDADSVYQLPEGGFTLVSFVEKASVAARQSLEDAIGAYRMRRGIAFAAPPGQNVNGLLVYPAEIGSDYTPTVTDGDGTIQLYPVHGSF